MPSSRGLGFFCSAVGKANGSGCAWQRNPSQRAFPWPSGKTGECCQLLFKWLESSMCSSNVYDMQCDAKHSWSHRLHVQASRSDATECS
eukprot:s494_g19.t1